MHEMGITQGILAASFEAAEKVGARSITVIRVSVGELTEIQDFALQFAFESLTPGTLAEGARLEVTTIGARSSCNDCSAEYEHDRFQMICPECGSFDVVLLNGRELTIDSIDTEDDCGPASPADDTTPE